MHQIFCQPTRLALVTREEARSLFFFLMIVKHGGQRRAEESEAFRNIREILFKRYSTAGGR